ncbi:MAG: YqzL family protein [Thermoanaerobacteraceae bacterium]
MWNLFKKTGNIEYFIAYKEIERFYSHNLSNKSMKRLS